ncbi:hypothetical protein [Methylobacterium gregans]|uniref:hypothetical protein n=1 Tax=Methylobacterium gregans TaxID=374424 RepID=UPI00360BA6A7
MNEILIAGLLASARDFHAAGQALTQAADSLKTLASALEAAEEDEAEPGDGPYKKANGRMTPPGLRRSKPPSRLALPLPKCRSGSRSTPAQRTTGTRNGSRPRRSRPDRKEPAP